MTTTAIAFKLRYPLVAAAMMRSLGLVMLGGAVALVVVLCFRSDVPEAPLIGWSVGAFAALCGTLSWIEARVHLVVDADGIRGQTAYRGQRGVRWDELETVRYVASMNWWQLVDRRGRVLRVSRFLHGQDALVAALADRLPDRVVGKAIKAYQRVDDIDL